MYMLVFYKATVNKEILTVTLGWYDSTIAESIKCLEVYADEHLEEID